MAEFDMESAQDAVSAELFPGSDETVEVEDVAPEESQPQETSEQETPKAPPKSWKKEMHEKWGGLDSDLQDYIELRESQMKEGVDLSKADSEYARTMRELTKPYEELFKEQGVDDQTAVKWLLNAHNSLSKATPEDRVKLFNQLAESYGVKLDGTELNPEYKSLQEKVSKLESTLTGYEQRSLQERRDKVTKDVEAFATEHSYFDDVADDIIPFINAGMSLEDAYEKAVWANPVTRQKEIDRIQKESEDNLKKEKEEKRKKSEKAKSANVRSLDTNKAPTEPTGSMEDTLRDTYREIQNR